jgi:hypothetical protein
MGDFKIPHGFKLTLKLKTPKAEIEKKVLLALKDSLNQSMLELSRSIGNEISANIGDIFKLTADYETLIDGTLRGEIGFPKGEEVKRVQAVIDKLSKQIQITPVRFSVSGNTFRSGGLEISMFKKDFTELFNLPEAHIITEKGEDLPWLEWLLLSGDRILITGYDVRFGNYGTRHSKKTGNLISRSGIAVMVKGDLLNWKMPTHGTANNNWITRAIDFSFSLGYLNGIVERAMAKWLVRFST